LRDCEAVYWGDIDTHGYAILNRARSLFPRMESVMMDQVTFLAHQELWCEESVQCGELELALLTKSEREVFEGLRNGTWGSQLRLEQERISWQKALEVIQLHHTGSQLNCLIKCSRRV